jgi:rare lipoprotein A
LKRIVKKSAVSLAAIIAAAFFSAGASAAPQPSGYAVEGQKIIWKVDDIAVWKFPAAYAADVSAMSERFNRLYGRGFRLADFNVDKYDGKWSIFIGDNLLYSVPNAYAHSEKQDPKKLALKIMSRIYEAIGEKNAAQLTPAYQIRGKYRMSAKVSWYGGKFIGRRFANGERFKETHLTAAAKSLPFGTLVKVTAPSGRSVVVRVTDRFYEYRNRLLDLSHAAAELLDIKGVGVPEAKIEVIGRVDRIGGK